MFKISLMAALLAFAISSPVPKANPEPKPEAKPQFLAYSAPIVAAPGIAYTSAYSAAPLAYSSYVSPNVYAGAYSYYSPSLVVV